MKPAVRTDILTSLPEELRIKVLLHLSTKDICSASKVSTKWADMINNNYLWKKLCLREPACLVEESQQINDKLKKINRPCRWADIYFKKHKLYSAWIFDIRTIFTVADDYQKVVAAHNNMLAFAYKVDGVTAVASYIIKSNRTKIDQFLILPNCFEPHGILLNDKLLVVNTTNLIIVYNKENDEFVYENLLCPGKQLISKHGEELEFINSQLDDTTCSVMFLAGRYVWCNVNDGVVIYDRIMHSFDKLVNVQEIIKANMDGNRIVLQFLEYICVYSIAGKMLYKYLINYKWSVTNLTSTASFLAFQQCQHPSKTEFLVQLRFETWTITKTATVSHIKRLTSYEDTLVQITQGPRNYLLSSSTRGVRNWSNHIYGLRPAEHFFKVICSRFIVFSLFAENTNMLSLHDFNRGNQLNLIMIEPNPVNIQYITNSCVVSNVGSSIKISSFVPEE